MKIIFFGSTDFSLPIVQRIAEYFQILGVVIARPKPKGRGLKIELPQVGQWAVSKGITVLDPENPNSPEFIQTLSSLQPDLFVLSAYGHILSGELLAIPKLGGINIHPSLLPKYRGAAPIQRAIMAGEKTTGVTIFFMDEKIDHGKIIAQKELAIYDEDTYGSLSQRLALLATETIIDVLKMIDTSSYRLIEQKESEMTYAKKITKEEMLVNWSDKSEPILNLIRALNPSPGARTYFRGSELIILEAQVGDRMIQPGTIHIEDKKLYVGTGNGSLIIRKLKPENRRVITALDFINGFRIKEGERIGT